MPPTQIAIYGAGGFAREVAWLVDRCRTLGAQCEAVCFIDDDETRHGEVMNCIPVVGLAAARERYPTALVVGAVGLPQLRQKLMEKAAETGFDFVTLIHPRTEMSKWVEVGGGTIICAGNILTTNIKLGRHVQINLDCTLGHDVKLGDYATLAPGVHVSGNVHIGERAYLGSGAVIINGSAHDPLVIGHDAVIGAGACVTKSVSPGVTVVGIPARPLSQRFPEK